MARPARPVEDVEFVPPDVARVLWWMQRLAAAGDGWVNLMPGVPDEDVEQPAPGVFSALFGTAQAPVTMGTWMPPDPRRRGRATPTVGILHPRGRYAVAQLAERGVMVPPGWQVRQDHGRRGLIVLPAQGAGDGDVLRWMVAAGTALAAVPLTGRWLARVYAPRAASPERSTTS